jgi:predicted outer membrane repeat protein
MNQQFDEPAKSLALSATRRGAPRKFKHYLTSLMLAVVAGLAAMTAAHADTLIVLNTLDKGSGSLRSTVASAQDGDIITFAPSLAGTTITLASGALAIKKNIAIVGPGADLLTISGNDTIRVLDVAEGATAAISGLTISHGFAKSGNGAGGDHGSGGGGGILNAGTLTVTEVAFTRNLAASHGGAIANGPFAILNVVNSTFTANQAVSRDPLAIAEGGAIYNSNRGSFAHVVGSTFDSNRAKGADGGILGSGLFLLGECNGGAIHNGVTSTLIVENTTFIGNQSLGGNGGSAVDAPFGLIGTERR